jgi:hypothetical protein
VNSIRGFTESAPGTKVGADFCLSAAFASVATKYSAAYPGGMTENCREVPGLGHECPSREAQLSTDFDIDWTTLGSGAGL